MLLTGFDAPVEQVMYIDKRSERAQPVAGDCTRESGQREKSRGFIVDYIGLANHLSEALSIYSQEDARTSAGSEEHA